ncbi:MAG TPA: hypothetical protein VK811_02890 [Candidatus Acidoferrum sp.]|jgi:hypothetical protein|nr:hypothetical protein [Candidatus Acidoferrum sp.]
MTLRVLLATLAMAILSTGCAFDISYVKQYPASFVPLAGHAPEQFMLNEDVKATLGTTYATRLLAGSRWQQTGTTQYGKIFHTKDQIVTVEASDIYEADLVVSNQMMTGFYLVVEKTFAPVRQPTPLHITLLN